MALGVSPLLARLLAARGWSEIAALTAFLYPRLEHTHSPWLLHGMEAAVARTLAAVAAGERILILGDYDADGTLATVILRQALRALGAEVSYALPERLRAGYGLQTDCIERSVRAGVQLAITVDTGIREFEPLGRARELGLDVIITDHHLPGEQLPPAYAIINPHQPACAYPDKGLCGSALAFKLAHALLERAGKLDGAWPPALRSYLKLVAIATVADAAPLLGENRVLTHFGLAGLENPVNLGLRALLAHALPAGSQGVSSQTVAFRIAPRLNAAGRMGAADRVVELFSAPPAEAEAIATSLELLNQQRQQLCARILADIEARPPSPGAIQLLAGEGWHRGVLGIVASQILQRSGRAAVIVSLDNGLAHGSGRAPQGLHLLQALEGCQELFDRFGGHAQAVGFSMSASKLDALRSCLDQVQVTAAPPAQDCFELSLAELTPASCRELARLEPFGEANPQPLFRARGVRLAQAPTVLKQRHLKLLLEDAQGSRRHTALFWNLWRDGLYQSAPRRPACAALVPGAELEIVFRLETTRHAQYGEQTQLILCEFFITAAAASH